MMLVALATAAVQALLVRRSLESVVVPGEVAQISAHASLLAADLEATIRSATEDIAAVRGAPAIAQFVSARGDTDRGPEQSAESVETLRSEVQGLFHSVVNAKPFYSQLRLIGVADGGRELVRVNRSSEGGAVENVAVDELQQKGSRDYFVRATMAPVGEVLLSSINLNREHGQIESPHQPVLRAATPVRTRGGEFFGAIVLNINAAPALQRLREANNEHRAVYAVDEVGNYLANPDEAKEFGADLRTSHRLQEDFPELAAAIISSTPTGASVPDAWTTDRNQESHYAAVRSIALSDRNTVYIIETVSRGAINEVSKAAGWSSLVAGMCAALCAAALAVIASRTLTKPLEQMTLAVDEFTADSPREAPTSASGEIGVLARAFERMRQKVNDTTVSLKREIEERRRAENEMQGLAAIITSSGDAIYSTDLDGVIVSWNDGAERLFGYASDEVVGRHVSMLSPPAFWGDVSMLLDSVQSGEGVDYHESQRLHKSGALIDVSISVSPIQDEEGHLKGVSKIARDITRRLAAEKERDRYEERFRTTVEAAPTAIVMTDSNGLVVLWNAAAESLFGYHREEMIGASIERLLPERLRTDHATLRAGYLANAKPRQMGAGRDLYGLRKDGSEVAVEIGLSPVRMSDGVFVLSTIADITLRKEAEEQLKRVNESLEQRVAERTTELSSALGELTTAKEAAESANRAKSSFLANMSHEIRTPMAAVMGASELLLRTELGKKQQEYTEIILESSDSLLNVINDILDFSRIEAGQLRLEHADFDHHELVGGVVKALGLKADAKGLDLSYEIDPDVPTALKGDPSRLRQVIVNLLGNALKFTEKGDVWLTVQREAEPTADRVEGEILLHFAVHDTGIGIPPDKSEAIFEAFEQADASTSRKFGGTGLGLAISSRLVAMMGGRLWFESEEGRGSTFHFTARLRTATDQLEKTDRRPQLSLNGRRVLVIEGDEGCRDQVSEALRSWGMEPDSATNADEAVTRMSVAESNGAPYQLLVVNEHTPTVGDSKDTQPLAAEVGHLTTPVIVLGSSERDDEASHAFDGRLAGFLVKPIDERALYESVMIALAAELCYCVERPSLESESSAPSVDAPSALRILLAEDSRANRTLIADMLTQQGYRVDVASNGREAVQFWSNERPDLVLMDVQMPEVDGIEATRHIRRLEQEYGEHTPIIAITAHAMKGDRDRCLQAGMDGYLSKPFQQHDLINALRGIGGVVATLSGPPPPEGPPNASAQPSRRSVIVDWSVALESANGDVALLKKLAEISVHETDDLLESLLEAMERGHADSLLKCAQGLKNHYRLFDAAVADHVAFHIENTIRDGDLNIGLEVEKLRKETHRLQEELIDFLHGRFKLPRPNPDTSN
ncbi:Signal transduction histidine-protein kinase BarA [Botrimarina colliarenosi]|uniref:Sensory/regulatory protein RpfC n=2 Tax=Botrimarina colliarenosi TaxID=2528001 RepID=A0A5C6ALT9_9BACT|nr:Signal transduction histidine-protein kinase BarA [Botrimarina colliarenosi]